VERNNTYITEEWRNAHTKKIGGNRNDKRAIRERETAE